MAEKIRPSLQVVGEPVRVRREIRSFPTTFAALLSLFPSRPTPLPRNALFSPSGGAAGAEAAVTALLAAGGPSGLLAVPLLWTSLLGPIL